MYNNAFCFIIKELRLHDLNVTVGTDGTNFGCFCGFFKGPGTSHQVVNMTCQETCRGRYVRLQIVSGREFLQLCEVEVYSICEWIQTFTWHLLFTSFRFLETRPNKLTNKQKSNLLFPVGGGEGVLVYLLLQIFIQFLIFTSICQFFFLQNPKEWGKGWGRSLVTYFLTCKLK